MNITDLIGVHPDDSHKFGEWLNSEDRHDTARKKQRHLTEKDGTREEAMKWLGSKIVDYHLHERRLERLKEKYKALSLEEYLKVLNNKPLIPTVDKTQKGNLGEILTCEYLKAGKGTQLIDSFKLSYNQNVEQSIKGDDILLVDATDIERIEIYLGEAKFWQKAQKSAIDKIINNLTEEKTPLSIGFLVNTLYDKGENELGDLIDDLKFELLRANRQITYVGLLSSDLDCCKVVDKYLDVDNEKMALITIGLDNPKGIIKQSFDCANQILKTIGENDS